MRHFISIIIFSVLAAVTPFTLGAQETATEIVGQYTVGVDDILEISVLQPDELFRVVNVAPDGRVSFPYIGSIKVKGLTIPQIQKIIQNALADGYMKHPVVLVSLQESRSRKFFVYGEVIKPGTYAIAENATVLRAISMAGGFTKFGSSSRVKVLRPKENEPGYENIKIDIKKVMNGDSEKDILLRPGDMVVVSEGMF
ncbi:MAG: polysaccharide export protein [Candidatus Omnitrophica bacterium]|nr:polysaccharide export protein [Candidatus Omnitrophota bacterium]